MYILRKLSPVLSTAMPEVFRTTTTAILNTTVTPMPEEVTEAAVLEARDVSFVDVGEGFSMARVGESASLAELFGVEAPAPTQPPSDIDGDMLVYLIPLILLSASFVGYGLVKAYEWLCRDEWEDKELCKFLIYKIVLSKNR
jgi:hypothetical protein